MDALVNLAHVANDRFARYLDVIAPVSRAPAHRVEFSRRMTTCWALIYYRQHVVRLSPYVFLLPSEELQHGSHWAELDATLRHEAAHAAQYARSGDTGHSEGFHELLRRLGVDANGGCDLGPENVAFRYVYQCPTCDALWRRRVALTGNWSCGYCGPGRYVPEHKMRLVEHLGAPWARLVARDASVRAALHEATLEEELLAPRVRVR